MLPAFTKRLTGGDAIDSCRSFGLSLVEVLVTIVIVGFLFGTVAIGIPGFRRVLGRYLEQSMLEEEYLIFLTVFERDYSQAEVLTDETLQDLDRMRFRIDSNSDGDYLDAGESIQYRWNKDRKRMDRKSGKGSFQSFLEGIQAFSWRKVTDTPLCYRMTLQTVYSEHWKNLDLCRFH